MTSKTILVGLLVTQEIGCAAVRSTFHLSQAEQAVVIAQDVEAEDLAPYEWTMTNEYILKAREEWGNASFGDAESLAKEANEWAARAEQAALRLQRYQDAEGMHEFVPEEVDPEAEEDDPLFAPPERIELIEDEIDP